MEFGSFKAVILMDTQDYDQIKEQAKLLSEQKAQFEKSSNALCALLARLAEMPGAAQVFRAFNSAHPHIKVEVHNRKAKLYFYEDTYQGEADHRLSEDIQWHAKSDPD